MQIYSNRCQFATELNKQFDIIYLFIKREKRLLYYILLLKLQV